MRWLKIAWSPLPKDKHVMARRNAPSQAKESAHSGEPSPCTQLCSQNIRFAYLTEKAKKVFKLYLRKNVPRSVWKRQGCRKRITAEDPPMIISLIGESWWTDKMTGKEISRVGPMYVHFNQDCLEQSDTENFFMVLPKDLISLA